MATFQAKIELLSWLIQTISKYSLMLVVVAKNSIDPQKG